MSRLFSIRAILLVSVIVLCALSKRRVHWFHVLKSLHDQSGLKERFEFLREAALMEGIRLNAVYLLSYFVSVISNDALPPKD